MEKEAIREQIFAARKRMSESERLHNSSLICRRIMETEVFAKAACVYAYMDCKGEVGMEPLLRACWETGKPIAVPKVFGKELRFFYITSYEDLASGYFHIPEPIEGLLEAKEERALMIVPGVAFDPDRHRCGYGGGFYDRYLEIHREHRTISPAFEFQIVERVPAETYDIFPQMIITEKRVISQ